MSEKQATSFERTYSETRLEAWMVWCITALIFLVHASVAGRYDIFRNEFYFIVCGRHPAFGYVDQPPLVPLLAAATRLLGIKVWLLRLPAAVAAAALLPLTAEIVKLLKGSIAAVLMAVVAAAVAPGLAGLTATLTTSTFEPLAWTACAYFVLCAVIRDDRRPGSGPDLSQASPWKPSTGSQCGWSGSASGCFLRGADALSSAGSAGTV
jgi:Dolichyl-phosphate-mannose-protein mannosyltransferase